MRGKHERLMKRAWSRLLPLPMAAVTEETGHGEQVAGPSGITPSKGQKLYSQAFFVCFLFLNIQVSCRPGRKGGGVLLHEAWGGPA